MDFHMCNNEPYLLGSHLTGDTQRRHPMALAMQPGPQPRSTVAACVVLYSRAAVHLRDSNGSAALCSARDTNHNGYANEHMLGPEEPEG